MITPYLYQSKSINEIAHNYSNGICRQLFQLPTGGGKTVCFSALIQRYLRSFDKKVVVIVHREELLNQARKTLYNGFKIHSEKVDSKTRKLNHSDVYVCMVETINNRLKKNPQYFGNDVGLVIIDECHIGNFKKMFQYFESALIVGVSATPIASSKKDPMKNYYDKLVQGPQIMTLIDDFGALSINETYGIKGINRKSISIKRGEFDNSEMSNVYSKSKNVQNVVDAYVRLSDGKKTIVFNCNVKHSKLVTEAFVNSGFESKHLDGDIPKEERSKILHWFATTPGAILNNIGVLTTGFDEPTIRNVIINRSTMSLSLWLQMTGRGSRTSEGKEFFRIIDMGGNVNVHGDWRADRDWQYIFDNPEKASDGSGVAPIRVCESCEAILPAQKRECEFCGHIKENVITYDLIAPEFEMIVGRINVEQIVEDANSSGYKEWKPFFDILKKTITTLKYRIDHVDDDIRDNSYNQFESKIKEWCKVSGKRFTRSIKAFAKEKFDEELNKLKLVAA